MKGKLTIACLAAVLSVAAPVFFGCSSQRKLVDIKKKSISANIQLPQGETMLPEMKQDRPVQRDTMKIEDLNGNEVLIMRAVKDEATGEMVATEELKAAVVTARFRNVAERRGEVDLEFQIIVTDSLQDSKWQIRFNPLMYILGDTLKLDPVIITGNEFRKNQLRGYQQYDRFLASIARDSTRFVDERQLEIFLERNIPQIFQFKSDTSFVSDEEFASAFGVTEKQAIEHYTNKLLKASNARKVSRKGKMWQRYVRNPIEKQGIRLDTVMRAANGDFIYNYIQTVHTRPKLRKVDIVLQGDIYDSKSKLYTIPPSAPLTFYISSLASFVDETEHYKLRIIERRAEANTTFNIDFESAKTEINPALGKNASEIGKIKHTLSSLMENAVFDLDSVLVTASSSPEGSYSYNAHLAKMRSQSVSAYFRHYMRNYLDSLDAEKGFSVDEFGNVVKEKSKHSAIPLVSSFEGENWSGLDAAVREDTVMTDAERAHYFRQAEKTDLDAREMAMRQKPYYKYLREKIYPGLRTVRFDFFLHRKGMVKDTVHTTVLDTLYMEGVQAIKDRDFDVAIKILRPYNDFNAAVAYLAMDYNSSALQILEKQPKTAVVNYMLAILYSRTGDDKSAVQHYLHSCEQEPSYVHRGNLDPEISMLIKRYGLNQQKDDDFTF